MRSDILKLILLSGIGYLLSIGLDCDPISNEFVVAFLIPLLLVVGLYGSVTQIDLSDIKGNRKIILAAITIGVIFKAAIIGSLLYLFNQEPVSFLLAVVVAQIDPLSVVALSSNNQRLSPRGLLILRSWSAFDDPMTALIAIYVGKVLIQGTDINQADFFASYFIPLGYNFLLAASVLVFSQLFKRCELAKTALLLIVFVTAAYFGLYLSIAIVGLFLRPRILKHFQYLVSASYLLSMALLGMLLINGVNLGTGLLLGIFTVFAQIVVGFVLTKGLATKDRYYLSLAQQNGITSIVLSLMFEMEYPGIVAVIGPALLTINLIHMFSNKVLDWKFRLP